jgi:Uma2 family endonuclease
LLNPTVLIEVLSPSTSGYYRGEKFEHYRQLDSLTEYLTVAQDKIHVEHHVRQPNGTWLLSETNERASAIYLASIACTLKVADIYEKTDLSD